MPPKDLTAYQTLLQAVPRPTKTYHTTPYPRLSPTQTTFAARGKTVLVTAGGTGIGLAISRAFALAGVTRLIIVSRRPEPQARAKTALEREFPDTCVDTVAASVTDYARMTEVLGQVAGGIDVLVLCHAYTHALGPGVALSTEEFKMSYETNVIANFHLLSTYLSLPAPAAGVKTAIHVSSASAHMELPGQMGYGSSKAAFNQVVAKFAVENPISEGTRLFSFHPGALYTEAAAKLVPKDALEWDDIRLPAHFAVWLASGEADFLHGKFVWAHWDVDEMIEQLPKRVEQEPDLLKMGLIV